MENFSLFRISFRQFPLAKEAYIGIRMFDNWPFFFFLMEVQDLLQNYFRFIF